MWFFKRFKKNRKAEKTGESKFRLFIPRITQIVARELKLNGISKITPQSHIERDLGAKVAEYCLIIMAIEEEFNIEISVRDEERLETIQDINNYLLERLNQEKLCQP